MNNSFIRRVESSDCALALIKRDNLDQGRLDRLRQEAQAPARFNSPNIVTVHDIGPEDGTAYVLCVA